MNNTILFFSIFCKLMIGHFLADYPLQGDFLAKAKNHLQPIPGVPWYQAMLAHAAIHAGMVWAITGNGWLALTELSLHFSIDVRKCAGLISFNTDQACHLLCKVLYAVLIVTLPEAQR